MGEVNPVIYEEEDEMRLLRIDEAAHRLGLKPSTVRKLIYLKEIPSVHPTRRAVRVREEDVEALIRLGYPLASPDRGR